MGPLWLKNKSLIDPKEWILGDQLQASFNQLNNFCLINSLELTFEWFDGQFWLHSLAQGENPIGINLDKELERHEIYFKRSSLHKELLARAIGIKGPHRPRVIDLTAGLLGDSLLFLSFGCQVTALERHPVVSFLLLSALQNAQHPKLKNLELICGPAQSYLEQIPRGEVLFYDPMYSDPSEKSRPKKEMRIFREIVGEDGDAQDIFQLALSKGPKRLVVKRPRLAPYLNGEPSVKYLGKSTRYDVYFSH